MENTETPQIQSFIDKYNEWLEQMPKSDDDVEFLLYSHLVIVLDDKEQNISARNIIHSNLHKISIGNMMNIHASIKEAIDKKTNEYLHKHLTK